MRAILIKDENVRDILNEFPHDYVFHIDCPLAPMYARVTTIPTDNVRGAAGIIAAEMTKRGMEEFIYFDESLTPYVDMARQVIMINHNQGLAYQIFFDNFFENLPLILKSPGIQKDQFKGIPALIVSAGPSLNKNIDLFPEAKGKCITITSGSAIGALQHKGWEPDAACLIDPYKLAAVDFKPGNYRLLSNSTARPEGVKMGSKNSFFQAGLFKPPLTLPKTETLRVDISVATTAFSLAQMWGCDPIIFIGQDCGKVDGVAYADGLCQESVESFKDSNNPTYEMIAEYFKIVFPMHEGTVYNCTEGGRHLGEGAIHKPLKEVLATLPERPEIKWEEADQLFILEEVEAQAKSVRDSYRLARMMEPKANSAEKIDRFLRQQVGTVAWQWMHKAMLPVMYECGDNYSRWYVAYLMWQEWCLKLANKLDEVAHGFRATQKTIQ